MEKWQVAWIAGILEGEGCFKSNERRVKSKGISYCYPAIEVNMTDEDIIRRLKEYTGVGNIHGPYWYEKTPHYKPIWRWMVQKQSDAIAVIYMVYPLMGIRRQEKIREAILAWKITPSRKRKTSSLGG